MMRAPQSHTLLCRHLLFWAVIVHLLPATTLVADDELVEKGREIFQRHWVHQPPKIPKPLSDQAVKNRGEFERRLMALPGDGLGPMHNATSCESCHAEGGAAGVDRNVTLLTLDPRSEFVSKQARQGRAKVIAFLASLRAPFKSNRQKVDRTVEPVLAFAKVSDSQNDLTAMAEAISVFDFDKRPTGTAHFLRQHRNYHIRRG